MYAGGEDYPVEENLAPPPLGQNRSESCKSSIMGTVTCTPPLATGIPTLKIDNLAIYKVASERDPPSLSGGFLLYILTPSLFWYVEFQRGLLFRGQWTASLEFTWHALIEARI